MSTPDDRLKEVAVAKCLGFEIKRGYDSDGPYFDLIYRGAIMRSGRDYPEDEPSTDERIWRDFTPSFLRDPAASDLILDYCEQQGWRTEEYSYPSLKQVQCVINFSSKSADTRYRARIEAILAACAATRKDGAE